MFDGSSVLITGGTGSLGQLCVKTFLERFKPRRLVVLSRDELKQSVMQRKFESPALRFFLGDVRDKERLMTAFRGIDYIIHAAALKQVPALEYNPEEAVKTNTIGAINVIEAALYNQVKGVIAISTDKAVMPINLYGATKLASDKLFVSANNMRGTLPTRFSVVRYGNVLGSRGSIVPVFEELLTQNMSSLPITDERMTRFIITLQEVVDFILKAFARIWGGETLIPKMPSVRITDLAQAMSPNAKHEIVGRRPGEKLHEVLNPSDVSHLTYEFEDFYLLEPEFVMVGGGNIDFSTSKLGEKGKRVKEGFEYRSDQNSRFYSVEEIQELLIRIKKQ